MKYQLIQDWCIWAKSGVMPQRTRCTLNNSQGTPSLSPFFSEDDLLCFDRRIAALSREYPLNGQMFKLRYLHRMTYAKIAKELHTTPQRVRRMIEFFCKGLLYL